MTGHLKILALALGLAVAGGSIAQAATPIAAAPVTAAPVADQTASPNKTQTPGQTQMVKPATKRAEANVMPRKHHFSAKRIAHLRHLRRLHEARLLARHHALKTVSIHTTKIVKTAHIVKTPKTVMAHQTAGKPVNTVR